MHIYIKLGNPIVEHYNWNELLSEWNQGDIKLLTGGLALNSSPVCTDMITTPNGFKIGVSRVLRISNFIELQDIIHQSNSIEELKREINTQCSQYGQVVSINIPLPSEVANSRYRQSQYSVMGYGHAFITMSSLNEAILTLIGLKGMGFDGRIIDVKFYSEHEIEKSEYHISPVPWVLTKSHGCVVQSFIESSSF